MQIFQSEIFLITIHVLIVLQLIITFFKEEIEFVFKIPQFSVFKLFFVVE
jgi:hypothetical protein